VSADSVDQTAGSTARASLTPDRAAEQTRTLFVAGAGTLVALALFTVPMCALPSLAAVLAAGPAAQTWMLSSMSVGLAAGLLVTGALADDYGRRRVFLLGAVAVALTCVLGVLGASPMLFVLARVVQGVGAAALVSCGLGLIGHAYPSGPARVRATGIWGACVGGGIALGPLLAATMGPTLGWRSPYLLLALLAVVVAVAARWLLVESRADRPQRVDLPGALLLGIGTSALLAGLVAGRTSWVAPSTLVPLAGGVLALTAFVRLEWLAPGRGRAPLLDLRLFRRPDFVAATVAGLATGLGVIAAMSFLPVVLERGLHAGTLTAALSLVVWSAVSVPVALLARRLRAEGDAQLAAGLLLVAVALLLLTGIHAGQGLARLLPGLVLAGIGSGVLNAALGRQAVASVPADRAGMGSGANNTARYLGSAVGVTVVAVLATHPDAAGLLAGWNTAVLVTAAFSLAGAAAVLTCRRRPGRP
jgi:MFS family permease